MINWFILVAGLLYVGAAVQSGIYSPVKVMAIVYAAYAIANFCLFYIELGVK